MEYRAFVASTYEDLSEHRGWVIDRLRDCGIAVDPMENWTADSDAPRHFSPARLEGCDLCVLLVAFRRGHIPDGADESITQLEYQAALEEGIDVLVYMLVDDADWDMRFDERGGDPQIRIWRDSLREHHGIAWFGSDPESIDIAPAVARWVIKQNTARPHRLDLADNLVDLVTPEIIAGSFVPQILETVEDIIDLDRQNALVVDLRAGRAWWSTRLFLLASLIRDFTRVPLIGFVDGPDYVGVAKPEVVATALAERHPALDDHYQRIGEDGDAMALATAVFAFADSFAGTEQHVKSWVDLDRLATALGTGLNTERVRIDDRDGARDELFLYEVLQRPADNVAVVDRAGSLIGVVDRAELGVRVSIDVLAAALRERRR